jgi:hypothetical protein
MLPNVLMQLGFTATAVADEGGGGGGATVNDLLLLGVGRIIVPFIWLIKIMRIM